MYKRIMVPVDLTHSGDLQKALRTAADLAKHFGCPVTYVAVTSSAPNPVARTPEQFAKKLAEFGAAEADAHGHTAETKVVISHDPAIDLDDTLMRTIDEIGADLVVMQSHAPNITDYIWPSNGGTIGTHSDASVFIVR